MTSNIVITIKSKSLDEAILILKGIVKGSIEDYTYPEDIGLHLS